VAIDARNGTILWSVATPDGTIAPGPLAVTNGVVFAPFFWSSIWCSFCPGIRDRQNIMATSTKW